jgi:NADPH-dependent curcumin reductase CurA
VFNPSYSTKKIAFCKKKLSLPKNFLFMNLQCRLMHRPVGMPKASDFAFTEEPIPTPQEGEILLKTLYISLDPAMRGWMNDAKSYLPPVKLGDVMRAGTICEVVASNNPKFAVGEFVVSFVGVQTYSISNGEGLMKANPQLAPLPTYLGTLGMTGLTAYFGLLHIGLPKEGETLVVSGAAGAVGMIVGQIGKLKGCRVVGIAGEKEKCEYVVNELGFDACINYKVENVGKALRQHCPNGIDIYFDNVGGEILDTVLTQINKFARIPLCGAISQYNATENFHAPKNYLSLLVNSAKLEGFIVLNYMNQALPAIQEMAGWMMQGKLKSREQLVQGGVKEFLPALMMLFEGKNTGKLVLEV